MLSSARQPLWFGSFLIARCKAVSDSRSHYDTVWGKLAISNDGKTFTANGGFASYTFDNTPITAFGYSGTLTAVGSRMVVLTDSSATHAEPLPGQ